MVNKSIFVHFIFVFASSAPFYNIGNRTHFVKFHSLDSFLNEKKIKPHENYPLYSNDRILLCTYSDINHKSNLCPQHCKRKTSMKWYFPLHYEIIVKKITQKYFLQNSLLFLYHLYINRLTRNKCCKEAEINHNAVNCK